MKEVLLLKCGEIVLKGLNRKTFEDKLVNNIKRRLKHVAPCEVNMRQSVIYVWIEEESDADAIMEAVKKIFGIALICRAAVCDKTLEAMQETAETYLADRIAEAKSFKVETKRGDKRFPMTSIQVSQEVGGNLADKYENLKPDMHTPELTIHLEIRDQHAFVHAGPEPGAGGMPVGTNGRAAMLLSGGIDSPVAGYMMSKRGLELVAIHFFSYPYTSERAKEKVIELAEIMTAYTGRMPLLVVPFTKIQEAIRDNCHEELFTLIMRRFMMRIAEKLAVREGCGGLITGESLGQVASQTMPAMAVTGAVCSLPVFRPVIGMDKEEIVQIARKIGTFETSILPYEDCCTVFTPKHPNTKPKMPKILEAESHLDVDALVEEAVSGTEVIYPGKKKNQ
ncbi:MAG: tRNA 4-thiouridine(8) synthase ThiI [Butyricicoccus pullicaecorum]|nr:tRNA 4-thiouridine(8) synthase ThiI [Butyricicoccus pullicaecorum]